MSEPVPAVGVVVAHGGMADGLVGAVRRIAGGAADALVAVSNEGKGPSDLLAAIEEAAGDRPAMVFVDLATGSCGMAAFSSCRDRAERAVVCGVNLPMLLDFVFHRTLPFDVLLPRVVDKGRASIQPTPPGS